MSSSHSIRDGVALDLEGTPKSQRQCVQGPVDALLQARSWWALCALGRCDQFVKRMPMLRAKSDLYPCTTIVTVLPDWPIGRTLPKYPQLDRRRESASRLLFVSAEQRQRRS